MSGGNEHRWQNELGARLRGGDRSALLEMYDQMGSFVYGVALRVTASPKIAASITEDVFLQVWKHPQELDGYGTRVRTRLAVLTHGRAVEWVRRERATAAARADGAGPPQGETGGFSDSEELAEALITAGRVQGALAELSPEQRMALEVTYFGGHTYEAAAAILGVTGSVVAARVSAALRHVSALLKPCSPGQARIVQLDGAEVAVQRQVVEGADPDAAR
jgi:RNA polymerase sigma-70 factor (ECF subfamily)